MSDYLTKFLKIDKYLSLKKRGELKLHLGCGKIFIPGWTNIDIDNNHNSEILCLDLSKPFPFPNQSAVMIFTEHIIECFSKDVGFNFLKECYRALKPGGTIRIGFSDFDKLLSAYYKKGNYYRKKMATDMQPSWTKTWDEFISDMLFSWDRKYYYTKGLLISFLKKAGFKKINIKDYKKSDYGFNYDTRNLPDNTYLEAKK